jgi:hypothetical protein
MNRLINRLEEAAGGKEPQTGTFDSAYSSRGVEPFTIQAKSRPMEALMFDELPSAIQKSMLSAGKQMIQDGWLPWFYPVSSDKYLPASALDYLYHSSVGKSNPNYDLLRSLGWDAVKRGGADNYVIAFVGKKPEAYGRKIDPNQRPKAIIAKIEDFTVLPPPKSMK